MKIAILNDKKGGELPGKKTAGYQGNITSDNMAHL